MARDKGLEELVRDTLDGTPGLTEVAMFGGLAWMQGGHLLCAARHDGLLARLGKGSDGWALALPGIGPMQMGARRMHSWVRADADAYGDDALRRRLLAAARVFVATLPVKDGR